MRLLKLFVFTHLVIFYSFSALAQQATIRGTVYDASNGEPLPGATIFIEGTTTGTITDFDGKFNLTIAPGTYNIRISFISYETRTFNNVTLRPGEVKVFDEIGLKEVAITITGITVTAERVRSTESALLAMKMKSTNLFDGISAVTLKRTGDSDAASSISRVTGVSVTGGKYIFVRGLGDRYSKTIMNGMDIPGLDPDRNTIQLDIFPTSIIDNLIVYKTFSAELPADFSGGIVDISLKDFPEKQTGSFTINGSLNPESHFNPEFLTYEGGKTDFLGFDDGTRTIPATDNIPRLSQILSNPNSPDGQHYRQILQSFNPTMATQQQKSFMDYGFSFSTGDQINRSTITIGYHFNVSYKNSTDFYDNAITARYGLNINNTITELDRLELQVGRYGTTNAFLSGMAGLSIKTARSKYKFNMLHLQNGESKAGIFTVESTDHGANFSAIQHNLDYSERSLTNVMFEAKHVFDASNWTIEWKLSPTLSKIYDPDIRVTRYQPRSDSYIISTETGLPERIWRDLKEISYVGLYHAKKSFKINGQKVTLQFGNMLVNKERDFNIRKFVVNPRGLTLTGDPNELFRPENLWPMNGNPFRGTTVEPDFIPSNSNLFNAQIQNLATYLMSEAEITARLKSSIGIRMENYRHFYTGRNQLGTHVLNNAKVLSSVDFFPTLTFIFATTEKQNLRFNYSKTIARPSFKELSYAEIFDPISGKTFIGGMHRDEDLASGVIYWDGNLKQTDIHNFDLRYEAFFESAQTISVSGFYKKFINPIEYVQYFIQKGSYQPRNVGDGMVMGAEFEFRLNLDLLSDFLDGFSISSNITVVESRIRLSTTELQSRQENARQGETVSNYRNMAGQAPYIINVGFAFENPSDGFLKNLSAGLYYNVQGPTLMFVGIADKPDIYAKPFHSLNFNCNQRFGKDNRFTAGVKIDNILNKSKKEVYQSFGADEMIAKSINPGTSFGFRLSYNF